MVIPIESNTRAEFLAKIFATWGFKQLIYLIGIKDIISCEEKTLKLLGHSMKHVDC